MNNSRQCGIECEQVCGVRGAPRPPRRHPVARARDHRRDLLLRQEIAARDSNPDVLRDRVCDLLVVARQHDGLLDPERME